MDKLILNNNILNQREYLSETEFEKKVIDNATVIFGSNSIYVDIKKKIGKDIVSIPDGYLIDFSFPSNPRLYIIEIELSSHDPYKHIGQQLLRFSISYKAAGRNIKEFLLKYILKDSKVQKLVESGLKKAEYRNIDAFLEDLIFDKPVAAIVIIDQSSTELENVLSQLTMKTDIIEFQTYFDNKNEVHRFTPFQQELRVITETSKPGINIEELNTIVVPANEDGFNSVFLGQNYWFAIRISSSMLDRIRYIAGYQTAPISAITYYAEVERIEKYQDTAKYIVYFKGPAKKISPIKQPKREKVVPQAPRYTTINRLLKAKTMSEVF